MLACSCAITGFKEAAAVSLELRFYRWDSVCIAKPDTRESGFIPVFNAAEAVHEIKQRNVPRELAVVVVGTGYTETQSAQIAAEWNKRLGAEGFRRVVVLRGNDGMKISGMPIIADFASISRDDKVSLVRTVAANPAMP